LRILNIVISRKINLKSIFRSNTQLKEKLVYIFTNYLNQFASLIFFFMIANNLSKSNFALLALIQMTSSIIRYLNLGTPFFVQNKLLIKPKSSFSLKLGLHVQFYFIFIIIFTAICFYFFGTVSKYQALLLFFYIFSENIYNYAELIVRSKGVFGRLIKVKIFSAIITIVFIFFAYFNNLLIEFVLIRFIIVWLISFLILSFEFITFKILNKAFSEFSVQNKMMVLFIKLSIPYGLIIYIQELFLIFPRFLIGFSDKLLIGELSFGLTVVANINLAISSLLQIDYNSLYNSLLKERQNELKKKLLYFYAKYILIYLLLSVFLLVLVPIIFNYFQLFKNFSHIKISFFIFISYYFIMTLITPVQILININKSNKLLIIFSIIFLLLLSTLFYFFKALSFGLLNSIAISYIASFVTYGFLIYFYFRNHFNKLIR
jgi:hypothetical protein